MDYSQLDEEERARRKAETVAYRTKKNTSRMFMVCMSIFEIVVSLAIIIVLFIAAAFVTFKLFKITGTTGQVIFEIVSIIIFIGGMILGFFAYKAFARFVIKKFKLEEKISADILEHYKSKEERKNNLDELRR